MKKVILPAALALAVSGASALAADMKAKPVYKAPAPAAVSPWDLAVGAALATDYNFRGISQSDRSASVSGYFEARYNSSANLQWYAGIAGASVKLATDPAAEIDLYGGFRPTFGALALDFGFIYYLYPGERAIDGTIITAPPAFNTTLPDTDFWEVYAKGTYTINDMWAAGFNLYYTPDWLHSGADGTYLSGTLKYTGTALPNGWGWYVSGELGHYWIGTTDRVVSATGNAVWVSNDGTTGWDLPDYAYWNAGIGFTYKAITIDLRYHDTNLSDAECNALTTDPSAAAIPATVINNFTTTGASNWCGAAFIGKLSFDTTLSAFIYAPQIYWLRGGGA